MRTALLDQELQKLTAEEKFGLRAELDRELEATPHAMDHVDLALIEKGLELHRAEPSRARDAFAFVAERLGKQRS